MTVRKNRDHEQKYFFSNSSCTLFEIIFVHDRDSFSLSSFFFNSKLPIFDNVSNSILTSVKLIKIIFIQINIEKDIYKERGSLVEKT